MSPICPFSMADDSTVLCTDRAACPPVPSVLSSDCCNPRHACCVHHPSITNLSSHQLMCSLGAHAPACCHQPFDACAQALSLSLLFAWQDATHQRRRVRHGSAARRQSHAGGRRMGRGLGKPGRTRETALRNIRSRVKRVRQRMLDAEPPQALAQRCCRVRRCSTRCHRKRKSSHSGASSSPLLPRGMTLAADPSQLTPAPHTPRTPPCI